MGEFTPLSGEQISTLIAQTDSLESVLASIDSRLSVGIPITIVDNEPFNIAQYGGANVGPGNPFYVQPGTDAIFPISASSLPLPSGAATSAKQDTLLTELQLKADLNETQPVSLASVPSHAVTNAGTFAVQGTAAGTVADDGVTPSAPVMTGGKAVETDGTDPTSVSAEDDVAIFRTDRNRRQLVNTFHPNLWDVTPAAYAAAQTNTSVKAAPGAGLSLYVTDILVSNGATAGIITLLDGSGGTVKFRAYVAINGGAVLNLMTPIRLTANTALFITSTTVTTHSVSISGFTAP